VPTEISEAHRAGALRDILFTVRQQLERQGGRGALRGCDSNPESLRTARQVPIDQNDMATGRASDNKQFPAPFASLTTTITARFSRAATETLNVIGNAPYAVS